MVLFYQVPRNAKSLHASPGGEDISRDSQARITGPATGSIARTAPQAPSYQVRTRHDSETLFWIELLLYSHFAASCGRLRPATRARHSLHWLSRTRRVPGVANCYLYRRLRAAVAVSRGQRCFETTDGGREPGCVFR